MLMSVSFAGELTGKDREPGFDNKKPADRFRSPVGFQQMSGSGSRGAGSSYGCCEA
jgi:hypothetical protein